MVEKHTFAHARRRCPFKGMTSAGWVNLALAAFLLFYIVQIALDLVWSNYCGHLGIDYCAFWSAGRLANLKGYASAYDPAQLAGIQSTVFPAIGRGLSVSPVAYLPVFLPPFQALALVPLTPSFWVWTLLNAACFVVYLRFFCAKMTGGPLPGRLLALIALSLPVYWNFLDGQVNVWLVICLGEFARRAALGQPFRAGLWLGGLLLKPQVLVVLVFAILLQRSIRMLAGLIAASTALLAGSLALIGLNGAIAVIQVWLRFAGGIPANDVGLMMNWRMLGMYLARWISPTFGWTLAGAGIVLTIGIALMLWRTRLDCRSSSFAFALLGTMAATGMVAWHANIHMAMILIPPVVVLAQRERILKPSILNGWSLVPTGVYMLSYVLASLIKAGVVPAGVGEILDFLRGASEFAVNAWILIVAITNLREPRPVAASPA